MDHGMYIFLFKLICIFLDIYSRSLGGFILGVLDV